MSDYYLLMVSFVLPLVLRPTAFLVKNKRAKFILTGILFYLWQVAIVAAFTFLIAKFVLQATVSFGFSYLFAFLFCLMLSGFRMWRKPKI